MAQVYSTIECNLITKKSFKELLFSFYLRGDTTYCTFTNYTYFFILNVNFFLQKSFHVNPCVHFSFIVSWFVNIAIVIFRFYLCARRDVSENKRRNMRGKEVEKLQSFVYGKSMYVWSLVVEKQKQAESLSPEEDQNTLPTMIVVWWLNIEPHPCVIMTHLCNFNFIIIVISYHLYHPLNEGFF